MNGAFSENFIQILARYEFMPLPVRLEFPHDHTPDSRSIFLPIDTLDRQVGVDPSYFQMERDVCMLTVKGSNEISQYFRPLILIVDNLRVYHVARIIPDQAAPARLPIELPFGRSIMIAKDRNGHLV